MIQFLIGLILIAVGVACACQGAANYMADPAVVVVHAPGGITYKGEDNAGAVTRKGQVFELAPGSLLTLDGREGK